MDKSRTRRARTNWEKKVGPIPKGWQIHHIGDRNDESIDNLICVTPEMHFEIHNVLWERYGNKKDYAAAMFLSKQAYKPKRRPKHSEEVKAKIREANSPHSQPNSKRVVVDGVEYSSLREASRITGRQTANIRKSIRSNNPNTYYAYEKHETE